MSEAKLNKILAAVRAAPPPAVPAEFALGVMRQVRREPKPESGSIPDLLNAFFPKLAGAALLLIGLCVAGDFFLNTLGQPDLSEGVAQISGQWFLPEDGI